MRDADPRVVWDALEAHGYGPHGRPNDFRARCPGHGGANPTALHVWMEGGNVIVYCHVYGRTGCPTDEIVERLGLRMRDLFPLDPGDSGRRLRTARRADFAGNAKIVANLLWAFQRLGMTWSFGLWLPECPNCEHPYLSVAITADGESRLHCQRGCDLRMVQQALADQLHDPRRRKP